MNHEEVLGALAAADRAAFNLECAVDEAMAEGAPWGNRSQPGVDNLRIRLSQFSMAGASAAQRLGGSWPGTMETATQAVANQVEALMAAIGVAPRGADERRAGDWMGRAQRCAANVRSAVLTFKESVSFPMGREVIENRDRPKPPAVLNQTGAAQSVQTISVVLNAFHVALFSIQIVNVQFGEMVEREASGVPEERRAEFKALAMEMSAAISSGDPGRIRAALEASRKWGREHPEDVNLLSLVLSILGFILGAATAAG